MRNSFFFVRYASVSHANHHQIPSYVVAGKFVISVRCYRKYNIVIGSTNCYKIVMDV